MELRTHIDFETRSLANLLKVGGDAYARHWSTAPLMLTYGTAPKGIRPKFELTDFFAIPGYADSVYPGIGHNSDPEWSIPFKVPCPQPILDAIARGDTFVAHNARFEQAIWYNICYLKWGWPNPFDLKWSCTAARARYFGLRASLDGAASDLEVPTQKDPRGKQFINDFCKPRKYQGPMKNGIVKELWYEPHGPMYHEYVIGMEYCITDGEAEADVDAVLPDLPEFEQRVWEWDFKINNRGVPIDVKSVQNAIKFSDHFTKVAVDQFESVVGVRPTQRAKVLEYLQQREEIEEIGDLRSKTLKRLTLSEFPAELQSIIQTRLDCSLASIKKLETMARCTDSDGNARGGHLYGGAHTMRWSHKRIQTGNMKRGNAKQQKWLFEYMEGPWFDSPGMGHNGGPTDLLDAPETPAWVTEAGYRFPRPLTALSLSMRGFIKAPAGKKIVAGDFAQIEARVLAWLAREEWLLEAFRLGQDPYVKFASSYMWPSPYEDWFEDDGKGGKKVKGGEYALRRQIAKSAVLGAGFGISGPKFVEYCDNSDLIISLEDGIETVKTYREAHSNVVALWGRAEAAAILAVANEGQTYGLSGTDISLYVWRIDAERWWLCVQFPSGRCMHYYRPKIEIQMKWGRLKETLTFRTEWNGKSYREGTYGGKLVENWVQGIARDIMCVGGLNVEAAGYPVTNLNHDEAITVVDNDFGSHEELCALMCAQEPWITDLPIKAEGATMQRYGK